MNHTTNSEISFCTIMRRGPIIRTVPRKHYTSALYKYQRLWSSPSEYLLILLHARVCYSTYVYRKRYDRESSLSPGLTASTPPNYSCLKKARQHLQETSTLWGPRGSGICIIYKDNYQASVKDTGLFTTFEHLTGYFTLRSFHLLVVAIYRPGSEPVISTFFTELGC